MAAERRAGGGKEHLRTSSHLELLAVYVRTGGLPWWADGSQPELLRDALDGLIQHANDNPTDDYWAYATGRFERCKALMGRAEFARHVSACDRAEA